MNRVWRRRRGQKRREEKIIMRWSGRLEERYASQQETHTPPISLPAQPSSLQNFHLRVWWLSRFDTLSRRVDVSINWPPTATVLFVFVTFSLFVGNTANWKNNSVCVEMMMMMMESVDVTVILNAFLGFWFWIWIQNSYLKFYIHFRILLTIRIIGNWLIEMRINLKKIWENSGVFRILLEAPKFFWHDSESWKNSEKFRCLQNPVRSSNKLLTDFRRLKKILEKFRRLQNLSRSFKHSLTWFRILKKN